MYEDFIIANFVFCVEPSVQFVLAVYELKASHP